MLPFMPVHTVTIADVLAFASQPSYVGPYQYQANLSVPVNSSAGSSQGNAPLTPLSEPPPFQVPPDIFQPRNDLQSNNSTCLVGSLLSLPFRFHELICTLSACTFENSSALSGGTVWLCHLYFRSAHANMVQSWPSDTPLYRCNAMHPFGLHDSIPWEAGQNAGMLSCCTWSLDVYPSTRWHCCRVKRQHHSSLCSGMNGMLIGAEGTGEALPLWRRWWCSHI